MPMGLNDDKKVKVTRLEDLEVKEVSLVDRGANKRTLLVVKNVGDPMPHDAFEQAVSDAQSGTSNPSDDLTVADDGTRIEQADGEETAPAAQEKSTDDKVVEAQRDKAKDEGVLITAMSDEVKAAYSETLKSMAARLLALGESVAAAKSDPAAEAHPEKLTNEIVSVSQALGRLAAAETDKAEKITAVAKGLLAETVGTAQLSLASMPMEMTAEGPMFKMPLMVAQPLCCELARKMLFEAEDALYGPDYDVRKACMKMFDAMKVLTPFIPDAGGMPQQMEMIAQQYAFNQPQGSIPAGVPNDKLPDNMQKAGRKISGANLTKLEEMLAQLQGVVAGLRPSIEEVAKADGDDSATSRLLKQNRELLELAKRQDAELKSLRGARPLGHASPQGEGDAPPSSSMKVTWPDDLNSPEDPDLRF